MSVDYRPARPEEMRRLIYNDHVAFGHSTAEAEVERSLAWVAAFLRPEDTLVAVEDGAIVSQMGVLPLTIRWNGRDIACGGVTAVSTLPTHRRRGYLRALMVRAFAAMRARGQPVAMLWASMAAIYQRFGYGVAFTQYIAEFDPRLLHFVDEVPVPGRMRLLSPEEVVARVRGAYERGKTHAIIVVAEGARYNADALARYFAEHQEKLGFELRVTILGHVQRGGTPGVFDRTLATRLGAAATDQLAHGVHGVLVGLVDGDVRATPLAEVVDGKKQIDPSLIELVRVLAQ